MNQPKRCGCCENHFPNTSKFFYPKGGERLDYVCRPCRVAINRATEVKRRKAQAAIEFVGPKRPVGNPARVSKEPKWQNLPRLTVWRSPVPAGYGVTA